MPLTTFPIPTSPVSSDMQSFLQTANDAAARTALGVPAGSGTSTGTNTGDQVNVTGNAGTATALATPRNINGVAFDGTANITVTAAAETLSGSALPALSGAALTALNASSLGSGTVAADRLASGSALQVLRRNAANTANEYATISAGGGDVTGPASSTDNHIAVFDGGTGKIIKDSGIVALTSVTSSTGAPDAGKLPALNGSGQLDTSFLATAAVSKGGTGVASLTAYAPVFGGTTSTGAVQSGTVGTSGQVLTSNGAGALPTFQDAPTGSGEWLTTSTAEISITGATTATIGRWHRCTGTSADYTLTLPACSGNANNFIGIIMGTTSTLTKLVTVDGNGSETIDGATSIVMWSDEVVVLKVNDAGTAWNRVAGKFIPMMGVIESPITTPQNISTSTVTKLTLNRSVTNVGSITDTANSRITIRRAGNYELGFFARFETFTAVSPRLVGWIADDATIGDPEFVQQETSVENTSVKPSLAGVRPVISLPVGQKLHVWLFQNSGNTEETLSTASSHIYWLAVKEINPW